MHPEFRRRSCIEERDQARGDSRLKARFLSYRLNIPSADESAILLTVDDWKLATEARPVGHASRSAHRGLSTWAPVGHGAAAVAVWKSGRIEALALSPGISRTWTNRRSRDLVPRGVYHKLAANGSLRLAEGLRVPSPTQLFEWICDRWGVPVQDLSVTAHRLGELQDAVHRRVSCRGAGNALVSMRRTDIRSLAEGCSRRAFQHRRGKPRPTHCQSCRSPTSSPTIKATRG